jgi:hypothetical protein
MQAMKIFVTDIWNDLRAKRLWPVALVLLLALVAVPVVLSKGTEEPPAREPVPSSARPAPAPEDFKGLASVELEESQPTEGSSLDTFDPSDPFRPPEKVLKSGEERASGDTAAGPTGDAATTDGASSGSTVTSGSIGSTGFVGDIGSTGDTGSTGAPVNRDGNGGGTTTTTKYSWVIDVTFTANGHTRHLNGMERLDMLPGRAAPLLLFLGASSNGDNAIFLVDSTLGAAGEEGKCKPGKSECALLHLGAGSAQIFTNEDGDAYGLKVDQIRKAKAGGTPSGATPASFAGSAPKITRVSAMRTSVGGELKISGRNFRSKRLANTIIFRAPNGRSTLVKPRSASTTKLVVTVPAALRRLLKGDAGNPEPTRFKLRVLTSRLGEYTPRRLSPVITN